MYLLMKNHEVQSQRIPCPPADTLESTCQLFSLPFRHEKRSGIFAVHPPLLGKSILIESIKPARLADSPLHVQFRTELRLLERLLWISGAEVVLREAAYPEGRLGRTRGPEYAMHWDLALLVFPGQSVSNRVQPLAIYPWWQWTCASYRLAGHLAASDGASNAGFSRISSMRMTRDLKRWFAEALQGIDAPTVLLSVPMVDGYIDQFVDSLSLTVCQGVLRYFKKQPLSSAAREILRRGGLAPQATSRAPIAIREVPAEAPSPNRREITTITPAHTAPAAEPLVEPISSTVARAAAPPDQKRVSPVTPVKLETTEQDQKEPMGAVELAQADLAKRRDSITLMAQQTAARRVRTQQGHASQTTQSIQQPRQSAPQHAQQPTHQPVQQPAQQPTQQYAQPPAPQHPGSARQAVAPGTAQGDPKDAQPLTNLPKSQRDDERLEKLRQTLLESPEAAVQQAAETLASRGIRPTPEKVEEYMQYLKRMLFQQDGAKGNARD